MNTFEFIIYSIIFWTLFLGGIFIIPNLIYKSFIFGNKYGWRTKINDGFFNGETPITMLIASIAASIGGFYYYIWNEHLVEYFEYILK